MSRAMMPHSSDRKRVDRAKILIVEDEQAMLDILFENLADAGYEVVMARDGLQAWQAFEREQPDLVTLDLGIPTITGFRLIQLLKNVRNGENQVPVIVVTGMDYEEAEEVAKAGADDYITKPFDPGELVTKVQAALARRS